MGTDHERLIEAATVTIRFDDGTVHEFELTETADQVLAAEVCIAVGVREVTTSRWREFEPSGQRTARIVIAGPLLRMERTAAVPACTCPQLDVTTYGEKPGSVTVPGWDPACPVCPDPYAPKGGNPR
jgi:hypothetical protein